MTKDMTTTKPSSNVETVSDSDKIAMKPGRKTVSLDAFKALDTRLAAIELRLGMHTVYGISEDDVIEISQGGNALVTT